MKHYVSVENFIPEQNQLDSYKEETFEQIDRLMERFLSVYLGFSCILATFFYQDIAQMYWVLPSVGGFILYHLLKRLVATHDMRYVLTAILALMNIVYIIQMNGAFYIHFVFFITLAVLVFYQSWRILVFYSVIIGLYNITCFLIYQWVENEPAAQTIKKYFLNIEHLDSQMAFFGTLLGTAQLAVSIFFANFLTKQTEQDARNRIYLNEQLNFAGNLEFANQIAEGKLDINFTPAENDVMGEALLHMRDNLKEFVENERLNKWKSDGVAQISDILVSCESVDELSQKSLNKIVSYLGAHQGIFYILHKDSFRHEPYLQATAAYAYDEIDRLDKRILVGDGLVGQAAQSFNPIYLQNPPDNFFKIKSAIGEAPPKGLMLLPLHVREELVGVVEIALLRALSEQEKQFLEEISSRIAASMIGLRSQEQNSRLLKEAQEQAEQIASQEEEMRQNVEELTSTQEELAKQMRETEYIKNETMAQLEALNISTLLLQLDTKASIISANERFAEAIRRYEDDLIGYSIAKLLYEDEDKQSWQRVWQQVQLGEIGHLIFKTMRGDNTPAWIDLTLAPVRDKDRRIYKYIGIGHNITRQTKQDIRLKKLLKETEQARQTATEASKKINEQLLAINNAVAMMEMDGEGIITDTNEHFLKILGYDKKEDLIGKHHRKLVKDEMALSAQYGYLWGQFRKGNTVEGTFERKYIDGNSVWIRGGYTPILNSKDELQKVIKLCYDVTELQKQRIELQQVLEQMRDQEEEMKMSMEHLQETQDQLEKAIKEFKDFYNFIEEFNIVVEFDAKGTILKANTLFEKVTGYNQNEVVGKQYSDYEKLENNETFEDIWKETLEGDYTERIVVLTAQNGSIIWLKTFYIPIHDQNGTVHKIVSVSDDISTQKHQEKQIEQTIQTLQDKQKELLNAKTEVEEREKFLSSLLSILDEVPALIGRSTLGKSLEILFVNQYGEELVGYDADYIQEHGFASFIHPDDLTKLGKTIKEKLATQNHYSAAFRVITKQGKTKTVWEYAKKIDFKGQECIDFFIIDPTIVKKNDLK